MLAALSRSHCHAALAIGNKHVGELQIAQLPHPQARVSEGHQYGQVALPRAVCGILLRHPDQLVYLALLQAPGALWDALDTLDGEGRVLTGHAGADRPAEEAAQRRQPAVDCRRRSSLGSLEVAPVAADVCGLSLIHISEPTRLGMIS